MGRSEGRRVLEDQSKACIRFWTQSRVRVPSGGNEIGTEGWEVGVAVGEEEEVVAVVVVEKNSSEEEEAGGCGGSGGGGVELGVSRSDMFE